MWKDKNSGDQLLGAYEITIARRREAVFLMLVGIFLGSLTMLNILGTSKLIDLSFTVFDLEIPFTLTLGVLPYPITFLCTDFISEIYGRRRANLVVWIGLILNIWVFFIVWIGGLESVFPTMEGTDSGAFMRIRSLTLATVFASMIAYLVAQFCDVHVFHFLKRKTNGRHLWLRNNGSTLTSQLVDSVSVILLAHFFANAFSLKGDPKAYEQLTVYILSGYVFKMVSALVDTVPFYIGTGMLKKYLVLGENNEIGG